MCEQKIKYRWFVQGNNKADHISALIVGVIGADIDQAISLMDVYQCYPVAIWKIKKIAIK